MLALSLVIVNYNTAKYLRKCVQSISESDIDLNQIEIIIVDNASSDSSIKQLEDFIDSGECVFSIKIINNRYNLGFSKSVNIGIRQTDSKYVCILNPDTYLAFDSLIPILTDLEKPKLF